MYILIIIIIGLNIRSTVSTVISHIYPLVAWLHKIIFVAVIILLAIIIIIIGLKVWNYMQEAKSERNILKLVETLNTTNKKVNEPIETIRL